ncbi:unnamed protein product (macronuclear) [Paramecium tetraurelia]|uniref:Transmembrane protein n=1 Tax=Paramecium tetraurelia TaxID=5888 RepID=A0EBS7_PARTE|nr:uncharacterized protein GSPATT00025479001 [Paramecium tetraurelia]CAK92744.1 unnamed protein product [Paramecium tetraurelia]|eukprot:XP_001460141.1 hypothetical protein (macronuclear) [Paramecium tetraurelia strain d4-2]
MTIIILTLKELIFQQAIINISSLKYDFSSRIRGSFLRPSHFYSAIFIIIHSKTSQRSIYKPQTILSLYLCQLSFQSDLNIFYQLRFFIQTHSYPILILSTILIFFSINFIFYVNNQGQNQSHQVKLDHLFSSSTNLYTNPILFTFFKMALIELPVLI